MRTSWAQRVSAIWFGVVLAGNFVAPTAKFQAPSLDLAVALEVGRITFRWMLVLEIALAILLVIYSKNRTAWIPVAILAVEWILVMPALDARTQARIQGLAVGSSQLHLVFIVLEFLKIAALFWFVCRSERIND